MQDKGEQLHEQVELAGTDWYRECTNGVERGGDRRHYSEPELLTYRRSKHQSRYTRWFCVGYGSRSRWRIGVLVYVCVVFCG